MFCIAGYNFARSEGIFSKQNSARVRHNYFVIIGKPGKYLKQKSIDLLFRQLKFISFCFISLCLGEKWKLVSLAVTTLPGVLTTWEIIAVMDAALAVTKMKPEKNSYLIFHIHLHVCTKNWFSFSDFTFITGQATYLTTTIYQVSKSLSCCWNI